MQQREEGRDDESRENEREKMKYLFKGVWKLAHGLVVTIKKEGKHKNDVDKDITGGKQRGWGDSGPDSKPKKRQTKRDDISTGRRRKTCKQEERK